MTNKTAYFAGDSALRRPFRIGGRATDVTGMVLRLILAFIFLVPEVTAAPRAPIDEAVKLIDLPSPPNVAIRMPTDIAYGQKGRTYLVDSGNGRILAYGPEGRFLFAFGSTDAGQGQLIGPVGIGTAADGRVLIADRAAKCIQVFDGDGNYLRTFKTQAGDAEVAPVDVAVNSTGERIYVTASEPYNGVLVYDNSGALTGSWGRTGNGAGEFRYPTTIDIGPDNQVYVVDALNGRVQVFNGTGKYVMGIGSWGVTPGKFFRPKGVTVGPNGAVLVSDGYLGVIQSFTANALLRGVLGYRDEIARFDTPAGVAVDNRNRLYVVEMLSNRVSVWQLKP